MSADDHSARADAAIVLAARIHPMLAGIGPDMQGAVLADLVAMWLAGHHPDAREQTETDWLQAMRQLVPINAEKTWGK